MTALTAWLLTVALHTFVLLTVAFALDKLWSDMRSSWRELLWKGALFGALLTTTVQFASQSVPFGGRLTIMRETPNAIAASPAAEKLAMRIEPHASEAKTAIEPSAAGVATVSATWPRLPWWSYGLWLWAAGAVFACLRMVVRIIRCSATLRDLRILQDPELIDDVATLAAAARVPVPRVLEQLSGASPLALTRARIVLPDWALVSLDRTRLRAMLAHELGHIVRRDPSFKVLVAFWCALFWWLPLARVAQHRLDELAELACDAFAVQHTGDRRGLAECLAACGEHHLHGPALALTSAMAERTSSLPYRVERLLEGVTMEPTSNSTLARTVALLALGAFALTLPGIASENTSAAKAAKPASVESSRSSDSRGSHTNVSYTDDAGHNRTTISESDEQHQFRADIEGKIAFTDDESDVQMLDPNGSATFEESRGGSKRRVEIKVEGGQLQRHYFVDGKEQPYDEHAHSWMKQAVLDLVRSGIGAEERVRQLYKRGGTDGVLAEIGEIHSDYVRGVYLQALMDLGKLTPTQLDRSIAYAGAMGSDYERHQALTKIFDKQALDPAQQLSFLRQTLNFSSDYELTELLIGILPRLADTPEIRQAWLDAGLKVKSDYDRHRTLNALVERGALDDTQLASVVQASTSIQSDYERRGLLTAVAQHAHNPDELARAYTQAVQGLSSDYERSEALLAFVHSGHLGSRASSAVLDAAAQIASSYECRQVLAALAGVMPADATLLRRYREIAGKLPDYDRAEAEKVLRY